MGTVTRNQWLALAILASSILMGGASQLDVLVGPQLSKSIVAAMILANAFLAGAIIIRAELDALDVDIAAQSALVSATSAVVGSAAAGPTVTKEAKVALLEATAALPEVTGTIDVTDKSLAEATVSPQVKAA